MSKRSYEFVVVGSGAGGATVASELARRGREVLVVERGRREGNLGRLLPAYGYYDSGALGIWPRKSREGVIIWTAHMAGGTTVVSCGNGVPCLEKELAALRGPTCPPSCARWRRNGRGARLRRAALGRRGPRRRGGGGPRLPHGAHAQVHQRRPLQPLRPVRAGLPARRQVDGPQLPGRCRLPRRAYALRDHRPRDHRRAGACPRAQGDRTGRADGDPRGRRHTRRRRAGQSRHPSEGRAQGGRRGALRGPIREHLRRDARRQPWPPSRR